jgi:uncharacterized protein YdaU (DUF1376 family)
LSAPPYMRLYWADYHQDTRRLTRDEHGAYFLLLGEAWNRGGYLPDDDALLARWALATPEEWVGLKPVVMTYFRIASKGRWRHKRISEELAAYEDVSRKRKTAGKKGGSLRRSKVDGNPEANAIAIAKHKPTKPEPEPEPKEDTPLAPKGAGGLFELEAGEAEPPLDEVQQAFDAWNILALAASLPRATILDDGRRRSIAKRLADGGLDAWTKALDGVARSRHCRGENDRKWRADLDFVCQPKSWRRLLEGFYGTDAEPIRAPGPVLVPEDPWRRRVRAFVANQFWNRLDWGPPPGQAGCEAPVPILAEFSFVDRNAA